VRKSEMKQTQTYNQKQANGPAVAPTKSGPIHKFIQL